MSNKTSLNEYKKSINRIYGGGYARTIQKNNAATKVRRQAVQKVSNIQKNSAGQFYEGTFEIEVKIHGKCRGDIDNVLKGILDSLNGVAYRDDKQCVKATVELCGD